MRPTLQDVLLVGWDVGGTLDGTGRLPGVWTSFLDIDNLEYLPTDGDRTAVRVDVAAYLDHGQIPGVQVDIAAEFVASYTGSMPASSKRSFATTVVLDDVWPYFRSLLGTSSVLLGMEPPMLPGRPPSNLTEAAADAYDLGMELAGRPPVPDSPVPARLSEVRATLPADELELLDRLVKRAKDIRRAQRQRAEAGQGGLPVPIAASLVRRNTDMERTWQRDIDEHTKGAGVLAGRLLQRLILTMVEER